MEQTQTILIILLSIGFAILLIFSLILVFIMIKVMSNVRHITEKVDETTDNLSEMLKYAGKKVAPAALSAIAGVLLRRAKQTVKRK